MAEMRVSDPSRLHLKKKELTQIRKAARVLRDPGTTSSWRSPLSSSRSAAAAAATSALKQFDNQSVTPRVDNTHLHLDSHFKNGSRTGRERSLFLYNWKTQKSSSEKSAMPRNDADGDYDAGSIRDSLDDSLSDATIAGGSRSDTYMGQSHSASTIFGWRDTSLASPSLKRAIEIKKKSKDTRAHLDVISRYQQKEMNLRRLLKSQPSMALGLGRDGSVEQSDDAEDYSNSEDLRKISVASPLLLKLKHKNWSYSSSKLLRNSRKEDSSYSHSTPALSTSSYNRYRNQDPSTVRSWDAFASSANDGDDEVDDHIDFPGRQGCGIPCYWSKRTPRHRGTCGGCYSPSLSDNIRRKGSRILCGSQSMYNRQKRSSSVSNEQRIASRSAKGVLPLLTHSGDVRGVSSVGTWHSDDELSTNFGELDLEALSRLDGRRWSNCRNQDRLEIVALNGDGEDEAVLENNRSLSQKYKPVHFDELIGQNIVVQSLTNAIIRGRIAPVYLFQGPRGTGKTSTARIFASALNCISTEQTKPCGYCSNCTDFISGKSRDLWEVDGTNKKGIDKVRYLLRKTSLDPPSGSLQYKVFVIDECHLLPSKMWLAFLEFLEEPPQEVVFIFITTDPDNVPRTVQSRCQRYHFNKIRDADIVMRLRRLSAEENLDVELDALDLIALNADGSLRDAETMLDQLSLLGKRITTSLVNELVGVVSEEKLLELLVLAMSSDTAETVKRARDLMDCGVDPMVLMSQLASLIMDIIAGTNNVIGAKYGNYIFDSRSLSEAELERLKHALKLLSEAEKQLRVSSDRSTWFTATLLQLGSVPSPDCTQTSSSRRQSSRTTEEDPSSTARDATLYKQNSPASFCKAINGKSIHEGEFGIIPNPRFPQNKLMHSCTISTSQDDEMVKTVGFSGIKSELGTVWEMCIGKCHSKTLRQLLRAHGKLLSVSEVEGVLVVYVAFGEEHIKARAERFLSSITNSMEIVLRRNVEVRIIHVSDGETAMNSFHKIRLQEGEGTTESTLAVKQERRAKCSKEADAYSDLASQQGSLKLSGRSFNDVKGNLKEVGDHSKYSVFLDATYQSSASLPAPSEANIDDGDLKERRQEIPMQRIESIIREQRLETAWLQAAEKGNPGSFGHLKPEKNQVLPREDTYHQNQVSMNPAEPSSPHQEDELNHEMKILKMQDQKVLPKDHISKNANHYPIAPSFLHDGSVSGKANKESLGYESSSASGGCSGLLCWNTNKPPKGKTRGKGNPARIQQKGRGRRFSLLSERGKHRKAEGRTRR